jgi:hypothetical protein
MSNNNTASAPLLTKTPNRSQSLKVSEKSPSKVTEIVEEAELDQKLADTVEIKDNPDARKGSTDRKSDGSDPG